MREGDGGHSGIDIQAAAIGGDSGSVDAGEVQQHVAEGLVRLLRQRLAHEFFACERFGLFAFALEQQRADFGEMGSSSRMRVIVRLACPDGGFVELNAFRGGVAEDHGAEPAIADRQRIGPKDGRLLVPEGKRLRGSGGWEQGRGENELRDEVAHDHVVAILSHWHCKECRMCTTASAGKDR